MNKIIVCDCCGSKNIYDYEVSGKYVGSRCLNCNKIFNRKGKIQRVDALPVDVDRVIINGTTVIVYLRDGNKGKANCDYMDTFDPYVGFVLAYYKSKNGKNFELKNVFKSCVESAQKKGYRQAILKNYDSGQK
jgi:hypothetical protein